jgi:hypothetical protein
MGEMISSFRQWIGRLTRTKDDIGELYILDSRYNSNKYKKRLIYWLEKTGIISDRKIKYSKDDSLLADIRVSSLTERIALLECEKDIKEYLQSNIDYLSKNSRFPIPSIDNQYSRDFKKRYKTFRNSSSLLSVNTSKTLSS